MAEFSKRAAKELEKVVGSLSVGIDNTAKLGAEQIEKAFKRFGWYTTSPSVQEDPVPLGDEEEEGIVYAKNNVILKCSKKIPGYLFVRSRDTVVFGMVLIINWVPNAGLHGRDRNPNDKADGNHLETISIDSSKVEEIRVFFSGSMITPDDCGHVTVREANDTVHVFEFSQGGVAGLLKVFQQCAYLKKTLLTDDNQIYVFNVCLPQLSLPELHPGETEFRSMLTLERWGHLKHLDDSISDPSFVQNVVFFRGICHELRQAVWPYLLNVYSWRLSGQECLAKRKKMIEDFEQLQAKMLTEMFSECPSLLSANEAMEKDVSRADLSSKLFDNKENSKENLKTLVLCYLMYNAKAVYSQGMTDLALPLLSIVKDIPIAFWCFVNLLETHALFMSSQAAQSLEEQIRTLLHLIEFLVPAFHRYLLSIEGGSELLFTHRWLLVNFKREFGIEDTLRIWESCWACPESNSFHLFVCVAIIAMYGNKPMVECFSSDELMIHFAGLALSMPVDVVLSQARGLLHALRTSKMPLPQELSDILMTNLTSLHVLTDVV